MARKIRERNRFVNVLHSTEPRRSGEDRIINVIPINLLHHFWKDQKILQMKIFVMNDPNG
jgi:hypothetical protein